MSEQYKEDLELWLKVTFPEQFPELGISYWAVGYRMEAAHKREIEYAKQLLEQSGFIIQPAVDEAVIQSSEQASLPTDYLKQIRKELSPKPTLGGYFIDDNGYVIMGDEQHGHSIRVRKATEEDIRKYQEHIQK